MEKDYEVIEIELNQKEVNEWIEKLKEGKEINEHVHLQYKGGEILVHFK